MKRREDWPMRLARFLEAASKRPFSWGQTDCALFAADWVLMATGEDPAVAFRGKYDSRSGAALALRQYGAGTLEATATKMLGEPMSSPLCAQRGDICSITTDEGPALGICGGEFVAVMTPDQGWGRRPLSDISKAWRV